MTQALPARLQELVEEFTEVTERDRLELLIDFGTDLPDPPERLANGEAMEAVVECQSPLFVLAEVLPADPAGSAEPRVRLHVKAPAQAPTTRGFAGVLHAGLDGASVSQVLSVPEDLASRMGLASTVSPLRLNGMAAIVHRIQRQVREKAARPAPEAAP